MNQYLINILSSHSIQFLKLSVQNIEENITSRAATFRLQRDEVNFQPDVTSLFVGWFWHKNLPSLCPPQSPPGRMEKQEIQNPESGIRNSDRGKLGNTESNSPLKSFSIYNTRQSHLFSLSIWDTIRTLSNCETDLKKVSDTLTVFPNSDRPWLPVERLSIWGLQLITTY